VDEPRVELQAELAIPRERAFALLSTSTGLARWLDAAEVEDRAGGAVHLRLREATVEGRVLAFDPPQHLSFSWDYPEAPLGRPSVVCFDAIAHGSRTHVTVRHVGLHGPRQRDLHEALWRYWFGRFRDVARGPA